ncbi:DUF537-domain-containing protein [Trametes versicolor FP-101664 SS1]|uniref:DUF537-domain-containing protein n=1 Tax=Trametes versicolor (strain FP-101664) TaxID=717944 RepID=UPI0004622BFC|nr:DUF537-domain-containing protein [Trametes versicolor FP-101664 SS1]EIW60610.1 DUF537-domain-containing protein [Trametes versicolor FP-101664 SS1]
MKDTFDEHVAIFWDYENCTPPCNVPGYDVVNNIRQVAHQYGSVKLFKAYLELSEQSSSKSIGLRSELQSCGVSLTDCPHNGRKDVADKMMIVDMLTYAIDNPAPATVVLISGDRDFVYAVSVLRLRRYRVVVVAPYTAHASLKSQASAVLDWEADIMRRTSVRPQAPEPYYQAPLDDAVHRSPRRPPANLAYGGTMPSVIPKTFRDRRPSLRAAATAPAAGPEGSIGLPNGGVPLWQGRHFRAASAATVDGTLRSDVPNPADRSLYRGAVRQSAFPSLIGYDDDGDEDVLADRQPIPDILNVIEDLQETMSRGTPAHSQLEMPSAVPTAPPFRTTSRYKQTTVEDESETAATPPSIEPRPDITDVMQASDMSAERISSSLPPNFAELGTSTPVVANPSSGTRPHVSRLPSASRLSGVQSDPSSIPSSPVQGSQGSPVSLLNPKPTFPAAASPGPSTTRQTVRPVSEPTVVPEVPPIVSSVPPLVPSIPPPVVASNSTPTPSDRSRPIPEKATEPSGSVFTNIQAKPPIAPATPKVPSTAPSTFEKFGHLVVVMEDLRKEGSASPLRSTVALRLLQVSRAIYAQAGTASFKDYSAAAERAGVVTMGGTGGHAWISLNAEFRNLAGAPSAPPS